MQLLRTLHVLLPRSKWQLLGPTLALGDHQTNPKLLLTATVARRARCLMNDLIFLSASEIARLIRAHEVSAVEALNWFQGENCRSQTGIHVDSTLDSV